MIYAKGNLVNGKIVLTEKREIDQTTLTADCFMIQFCGAEACSKCEYLNKPRKCGGMRLREKYGVPAPVVKKRKSL
jgi:hypothetical protein